TPCYPKPTGAGHRSASNAAPSSTPSSTSCAPAASGGNSFPLGGPSRPSITAGAPAASGRKSTTPCTRKSASRRAARPDRRPPFWTADRSRRSLQIPLPHHHSEQIEKRLRIGLGPQADLAGAVDRAVLRFQMPGAVQEAFDLLADHADHQRVPFAGLDLQVLF